MDFPFRKVIGFRNLLIPELIVDPAQVHLNTITGAQIGRAIFKQAHEWQPASNYKPAAVNFSDAALIVSLALFNDCSLFLETIQPPMLSHSK
jgi:hypothetical protein